ncbi:MAG TPA: hypothetical protein VGK73_34955 [Polyangiaceae bacterium]
MPGSLAGKALNSVRTWFALRVRREAQELLRVAPNQGLEANVRALRIESPNSSVNPREDLADSLPPVDLSASALFLKTLAAGGRKTDLRTRAQMAGASQRVAPAVAFAKPDVAVGLGYDAHRNERSEANSADVDAAGSKVEIAFR